MAKRSAEDAELDNTQNVDNNEEYEESEPNEEEEDNELEGEGDEDSIQSDDSSDSTPDGAGLRAFALSWLEDKRIDGALPHNLFASLGMKVALQDMSLAEQWELLERVVTSEGVSQAIFRSLFYSHRYKLPHINNISDVVELIRNANNIIVLTGAGVSVSCGIPDFRSPGGLYEVIEEKYNLPDPQCLFDIHYLRDDPHPFFEFAREIYPGNHKPSATHYFIKELAQRGKLLRNYTQNIDTLEMVAGIEASKLVNCHGSFATASCIVCKKRVQAEEIRTDIMNSTIPICTVCNDDSAFMKPDIVFFGEPLPDRFDECLKEDTEKVDLLLVMGSSLQVKPVAYVPEVIKSEIPQVLVNRELVAQPHEFDYAYLGDCDAFVLHMCEQLNWTLDGKPLSEFQTKPLSTPSSSSSSSSTSSSISVSSISTSSISSSSAVSASTISSCSCSTSSDHVVAPLSVCSPPESPALNPLSSFSLPSTPTLTPLPPLPSPTLLPLPSLPTPTLMPSLTPPIFAGATSLPVLDLLPPGTF